MSHHPSPTRRETLTPGLVLRIWNLHDGGTHPSLIAEQVKVAKSVIERTLAEPRPREARAQYVMGPLGVVSMSFTFDPTNEQDRSYAHFPLKRKSV